MQTAIIIPTYNESTNIRKLINNLFKLYKSALIVVVDDNSPDGTSEIVSELQKKQTNLFLLTRRRKGGRGSAVMEGLKVALSNRGVKYFVEMDADFSHRPEEIVKMLKVARKSDIVIGSRYLSHSKIYGWSMTRRVFSKLANFYCRIFLGIPISDYTNGFRCYRRYVITKLLKFKFKTKGYIVLSETAYFLHRRGFKFAEVPTIFINRARGRSNFSLGEVKESVLAILKIRLAY